MRNLIVSALLLFTLSGVSQPSKDSLLIRDYKKVEERLLLMHYLDHFAIMYFVQHPDAGKAGNDANFVRYYNNVIGADAVLSAKVAEYLKYSANAVPDNYTKFMKLTAERNIRSFISIIETYGYPSGKRIKINLEDKDRIHAVFTARTDMDDKKLRKLLKSELQIGNLSATDYDAFMYFMNNRQQPVK